MLFFLNKMLKEKSVSYETFYSASEEIFWVCGTDKRNGKWKFKFIKLCWRRSWQREDHFVRSNSMIIILSPEHDVLTLLHLWVPDDAHGLIRCSGQNGAVLMGASERSQPDRVFSLVFKAVSLDRISPFLGVLQGMAFHPTYIATLSNEFVISR